MSPTIFFLDAAQLPNPKMHASQSRDMKEEVTYDFLVQPVQETIVFLTPQNGDKCFVCHSRPSTRRRCELSLRVGMARPPATMRYRSRRSFVQESAGELRKNVCRRHSTAFGKPPHAAQCTEGLTWNH